MGYEMHTKNLIYKHFVPPGLVPTDAPGLTSFMSKSQPTTTPESPFAARPWLNHYDYWVRQHMNYPRRPLYEILRITAVEVPDRPATAFLGAHLTFGQIK